MIENNKKNIDQLFKAGLEDYEEDCPSFVWDNITEELDKNKRKRILRIAYSAAASVLLLLAFGAGYFLTPLNGDKYADNVHSTFTPAGHIVTNNTPITDSVATEKNVIADNVVANNDKAITDNKAESKKKEVTNNTVANNKHTSTKEQDRHIAVKVSPSIEEQVVYSELDVYNYQTTKTSKDIVKLKRSEIDFVEQDDNIARTNIEEDIKKKLNRSLVQDLPIKENNALATEKEQKSGWSVGGQFAPIYAYQTSSNAEINTANYSSSSNYSNNSKETARSSYSGGLNVEYKTKKRWAFQSGLFYSKRGQAIENLLVDSRVFNTQNIYSSNTAVEEIYFDEASAQKLETMRKRGDFNWSSDGSNKQVYETNLNLEQNFSYLEIPMIVKYKIVDRKVGMNLIGGFNTDVLIAKNIAVEDPNGTYWKGSPKETKALNYSGVLGVGFNYSITKNIALKAEPTFRYLFEAESLSSEQIYNLPYSFAFFSGISYRF